MMSMPSRSAFGLACAQRRSDMVNVGVVIQARMGSTRFPGKVLADLAGRPVLSWVTSRCGLATTVQRVVVATTTESEDDAIEALCVAEQVACYRGSVNDVLGRYQEAAKTFDLDVVVRVTADCPLMDPDVIDDVVTSLLTSRTDYASNSLPMSLPHGLEVSAMTRAALDRIANEATSPSHREHVTLYARQRPHAFSTRAVEYDTDAFDLRITIDHPIDLEVVRFVVSELRRRGQFGYVDEVVAILRDHPEVARRNAMHRPGEGLLRSLAAEEPDPSRRP